MQNPLKKVPLERGEGSSTRFNRNERGDHETNCEPTVEFAFYGVSALVDNELKRVDPSTDMFHSGRCQLSRDTHLLAWCFLWGS